MISPKTVLIVAIVAGVTFAGPRFRRDADHEIDDAINNAVDNVSHLQFINYHQ